MPANTEIDMADFAKLGPDNAKVLEVTFGIFYQIGIILSHLFDINKLLYVKPHIRREVGLAFDGILKLVRDVSIHYHAEVHGMMSGETSLDFMSLFGGQIDGFYAREKYITDAVWKHQLGEDESISIATLRSWLDTHDRMLKKLYQERLLTPEHGDEYTCEWFQRHLMDFSRSQDDVFAMFGPEGCGKTYLSRWIIERLQRRLGKKTCESHCFVISDSCYCSRMPVPRRWYQLSRRVIHADFRVS